MSSLVELTANIVSTHCAVTEMATEDLLREIESVYRMLNELQTERPTDTEAVEPAKKKPFPAISLKKAFQQDQVICLICGKGDMKTLSRHLKQAHDLLPGEYRNQFGIPRTQPLAAKQLSDSRRQFATEKGLAQALSKAREARGQLPTKGGSRKTKAKAKPPKTQ